MNPIINNSNISYPHPIDPPDSPSFEDAIKTVKEGKNPFIFVKVLNEEEIKTLDSLSPIEAKQVVRNLLPNSCLFSADKSANVDQAKIEKAYEALKRMNEKINTAELCSFPIAKDNVTLGWHTDSYQIALKDPQAEVLRTTFAIKGATTQFFLPTEAEYRRFCEINDYQLIVEEVKTITEKNPDRVQSGAPYDICIFHAKAIHRSPPSSNEDRVFITFVVR